MIEKEGRCTLCGCDIIHVSSGVDEKGEWHTLECDGCGWVAVWQNGKIEEVKRG